MFNHPSSALPRVTEEILNEQEDDNSNINSNIDTPVFSSRQISFQDTTASASGATAEPYDPYYDSDAEAAPFGWAGTGLGAGVSKDTLQEGQVIKAGYLMKKGERIKIWKKRWFVLRTSKFAYYKDDKEYELLRILDVRDVHRAAEVPAKHKSAVFMILTPRRTFTVQAKSVAEMQEWLQAINQAKVQSDFMASTSDLDSFAGSTVQLGLGLATPTSPTSLQQQLPLTPAHTSSTSSQQSAHKAMARQSISDVILARRQPPHHHHGQLSLADQELHEKREASSTRNKGKNVVRPLSVVIATGTPSSTPLSTPLLTDTSILDRPAPRRAGSRRAHTAAGEGLSLITTSTTTSGTQAIQIASPSSPRMEHVHTHEPALGSFSSGQSYNNVISTTGSGAGGTTLPATPMTPSSPGYNSGGDFFWNTGNDPGFSSGDEECGDEECEDFVFVVEAGRVATEANAPGSGIVTGEQVESKVVRSGSLLKLGNKYKTWRKRWFVLRGDKLTYYKNHKEYQPHGIIPLSTIIDCLQTDPVSKSKQYCLRIVTAKRSFVCCAPDEDTLLQWLDALHVECDRVALEARQEAVADQVAALQVQQQDPTTTGAGGAGDTTTGAAGLTKVESVEESESPTKPLGRTARIRMSFHSTLPRAQSISRSRSKSGDGSVSGVYGAGGLLSPSSPSGGTNTATGGTTSQIRKVMSLESGVGPGNGVVGGGGSGGGDGLHAQGAPMPVA
ncbi:hypothetical protein BGZ95_002421 [Linnemannia exigua]|uniref:PH domain-containing protein n=1 Tax=Linnemannia exigua TaxID=604196 RepID=A0AAD4D794_9FUNG|nr:hypothetical protein BGZ95_002421 [Linnemannia exigua]